MGNLLGAPDPFAKGILSVTILVKILDGEVQAAARQDRDGNINASNYELRPMPTNMQGPQACRTVTLVPRRRTRFTLDGHACVDMSDMAIVRMQGLTAKCISFLVGRAEVVQEFRKIGEFWYSSTSRSAADVKFLGRTELIIKYLDSRLHRERARLPQRNCYRRNPARPDGRVFTVRTPPFLRARSTV